MIHRRQDCEDIGAVNLCRQALVASLVALVFVLAIGAPARASDVSVRSGEHEDFSRLVLAFPTRTQWSFGRVAGGFELRSDDKSARYDLADVYDLIPRTRISAIRDLGDGRLFLAVECDCHGDAFDLRGPQVVLDIKDGPPRSASAPFNRDLPAMSEPIGNTQGVGGAPGFDASPDRQTTSPSNPAAASAFGLGSGRVNGFDAALERPSWAGAATATLSPAGLDLGARRHGLPLFLPPTQEIAPMTTATGLAPGVAHALDRADGQMSAPDPVASGQHPDIAPASDQTEQVSGTQARVAETEAALLEQIGRATSQGLLRPDLSQIEARVEAAVNPLGRTAREEEDGSTLATPADPVPQTAPASGPEAHMRIETAVDRAGPGPTRRGQFTDSGRACPDDAYFDVAAWGDDVSDGARIGTYRSGLLGEFDRPDPDAITRLIHYYIYLGFGAEASALIREYQDDLDRPDLLFVLAEIADGRLSDSGRLMAPYLECDGLVALWAAAAQERLTPGQDINTQAVVAAFSALPPHLRRYLGPPMASRFVAANDKETASAIRSAVMRAPGAPTAELELLNARVALSQDQDTAAIAALEGILTENSSAGPQAIIDLLALKREKGNPIAPDEIALAASLALEHRGTSVGADLAAAEIKSLAATDDFQSAFKRLEHYSRRGDILEERASQLRAWLLNELTGHGSDAEFLRFTLSANPSDANGRAARENTADRLAGLGFGREARGWLGFGDSAPSPDERLVYARIASDEGKPEIALGYLAGLEGRIAQEMRANALAAAGDHNAAGEIYAALGETAARTNAAWRAGDWGLVAALDEGARARAGDLMAATPQISSAGVQAGGEGAAGEPGNPLGPLAQDRVLLDSSRETRDVVSALLSELAVP